MTEPAFSEPRSFPDQVRYVLREGSIRHAVVESKSGHMYVDLPLTLVVLGAVFAPWLAAIGVVIAVVAGCSIRVERHEDTPAPEPTAELPAAPDEPGAP